MTRHKLEEDTKYIIKYFLTERRKSSSFDYSPIVNPITGKPVVPFSFPEVNVEPAPLPEPVSVGGSRINLTADEIKKRDEQQKKDRERELKSRSLPLSRDGDLTLQTHDPKYFENLLKSISGPIITGSGKDATRSIGSSGRGRGAPKPVEPDPRARLTGDKEMRYNTDILLGQSAPQLSSFATGEDPTGLAFILQPYKELQKIKIYRDVIPATVLSSLAASAVAGAKFQPYAYSEEAQEDPVSSQLKQEFQKYKTANKSATDDEAADAALKSLQINYQQKNYKSASDMYNYLTSNTVSDTKSDAGNFANLVRTSAKNLTGLGGLDPYFGTELANKLLGGEWIEKAMKNIAPSQERGFISSAGHRSGFGAF